MTQERGTGRTGIGVSLQIESLEDIDGPVLLMQGNPRLVLGANKKAQNLFGMAAHEVEGKRGGQVFSCVHSYSEAGCGKDINCEPCKIKGAIVDTLDTGQPHHSVSSVLRIRQAEGERNHVLQISTEKAGEYALVRIERYEGEA